MGNVGSRPWREERQRPDAAERTVIVCNIRNGTLPIYDVRVAAIYPTGSDCPEDASGKGGRGSRACNGGGCSARASVSTPRPAQEVGVPARVLAVGAQSGRTASSTDREQHETMRVIEALSGEERC